MGDIRLGRQVSLVPWIRNAPIYVNRLYFSGLWYQTPFDRQAFRTEKKKQKRKDTFTSATCWYLFYTLIITKMMTMVRGGQGTDLEDICRHVDGEHISRQGAEIKVTVVVFKLKHQGSKTCTIPQGESLYCYWVNASVLTPFPTPDRHSWTIPYIGAINYISEKCHANVYIYN